MNKFYYIPGLPKKYSHTLRGRNAAIRRANMLGSKVIECQGDIDEVIHVSFRTCPKCGQCSEH